mmetsp:Transcript_52588/g.140126  ORF Transcript_52588/g.140126 Transcript_52588/m.140126 type:complete len:203 (+) Transcript_52588:472-1080(+)
MRFPGSASPALSDSLISAQGNDGYEWKVSWGHNHTGTSFARQVVISTCAIHLEDATDSSEREPTWLRWGVCGPKIGLAQGPMSGLADGPIRGLAAGDIRGLPQGLPSGLSCLSLSLQGPNVRTRGSSAGTSGVAVRAPLECKRRSEKCVNGRKTWTSFLSTACLSSLTAEAGSEYSASAPARVTMYMRGAVLPTLRVARNAH